MTWLDAFHEANSRSIPRELIRHPDPGRVPCTADDLGLPDRMDGDGPLVSVILPTYDDEAYLPDALESVGAQTHSNLELLVVDSSGVSWVESLAADRDWIHYLPRDPGGPSVARNDAIEAATGEYVALLDADDYWHPGKIERQVERLDGGADAVYAAIYEVDFRGEDDPEWKANGPEGKANGPGWETDGPEGNDEGDRTTTNDEGDRTAAGDGSDDPPTVWCRDASLDSPESAHLDRIRDRIVVYPSTLVFRRSEVPDRPFVESLDAWEDTVFLVELFERCPPDHVADPLAVYRNRPDSITGDRRRMYRNRVAGLDYLASEYPGLEPLLERDRAKEERRIGRWHLERGERATARRHLAKSLRLTGVDPVGYKAAGLYVAASLPVDGARSVELLRGVRDAMGG